MKLTNSKTHHIFYIQRNDWDGLDILDQVGLLAVFVLRHHRTMKRGVKLLHGFEREITGKQQI